MKTLEEMHLACQYLAAAGISFTEKQEDDSHTNLGWSIEHHRFDGHLLLEDIQMAISLKSGELQWLKNGEVLTKINLENNTHSSILNWINEEAKSKGIQVSYNYDFHYDLPYSEIEKAHVFQFDSKKMKEMANRLDTAQKGFTQFLKENELASPIRVWPHHFDLGLYTELEDDLFLGAGLAIPDSLEDDFYYYASGYKKGEPIETKKLEGLTIGEMRSDWDGATLASSGVVVEQVIQFLNQSTAIYQSID